MHDYPRPHIHTPRQCAIKGALGCCFGDGSGLSHRSRHTMAMLLSRGSRTASYRAKAPLINNKMYVYVATDVILIVFFFDFFLLVLNALFVCCVFWNLSIYINNLSSSFHLNCFFPSEGMHTLKFHFRHFVADSYRKSYLSGLNPLRRWSVMNIQSSQGLPWEE